MKYILTQEKLEKFIHKYMDMKYPDLFEYKYNYDEGTIYKDKNDDTIFLVTDTHVFFDGKMMHELMDMFNLEEIKETLEPLGSWVEKKYGIKGRILF